jgi:hypothetical protein
MGFGKKKFAVLCTLIVPTLWGCSEVELEGESKVLGL